ncbi:MAG: hypothetical protein MJ208_04125, partial [Bacilli bacterium]|nr:hypothetical protein [Bacilli bacterium]
MGDIKLEDAKRLLKAIKANKQKYLTCELLAKDVGLYPDIIAGMLSYFDPIIQMDMTYDVRNITNKLAAFVKEKDENRRAPRKVNKLAETQYKTVNDFVFAKYVVAGGLMDRSIEL